LAGARWRGRVCPSCRPRIACAPPSCCKGGEHERGHGEVCWGTHASAPTVQVGECVRGWARCGCERARMWPRARDVPMRVWGMCVWVRVVRVRVGGQACRARVRVRRVLACVGLCAPGWHWPPCKQKIQRKNKKEPTHQLGGMGRRGRVCPSYRPRTLCAPPYPAACPCATRRRCTARAWAWVGVLGCAGERVPRRSHAAWA